MPSFTLLLRDVDGTFGASWWGWLLPLAAAFALVLCRGDRRRVATKLATIATLTLVLVAVVVAALAGLVHARPRRPAGALRLDPGGADRPRRRRARARPARGRLRLAPDGRRAVGADAGRREPAVPRRVWARSFRPARRRASRSRLRALAPSTAGGYRVLWLGDPSVLPHRGWTVAPGLEAATSMDGLPGGSTLFTPPDSGTSDVIMEAVRTRARGRTVRLGSLLAPAGISTIVVMNSGGARAGGVQSVPLHRGPGVLVEALERSERPRPWSCRRPSVEVYSNSFFHGIVAASRARARRRWRRCSRRRRTPGRSRPGVTVVAGLAPGERVRARRRRHSRPRATCLHLDAVLRGRQCVDDPDRARWCCTSSR